MTIRFLTIFVCLAALLPAGAQDFLSTAADAPVEVIKGDVEYVINSDALIVTSSGGKQATLAKGQTAITADVIEYQSTEEILSATGDVKLWENGRILRGERMWADLKNDTGTLWTVLDAELNEGLYFKGERLEYKPRQAGKLETVDGKETVREYTLFNGSVTGNELPHPYYYFKFDRLVVVPDQRYWLYDMVFYTQFMPMAYMPFYSQSLRENKVAYYLWAAHYSKLGFAVFNKLNITPSDEYMIDLYGDYYTKAGIGKGAKFQWNVDGEYGPEGQLYGYHIHQEAPDNDHIFDGDDRYHFAVEYAQDLPYDMRLTVKGHKFSDSEYRDDYRSSERVRQIDTRESERDLTSNVNFTKRFDDQSLRITGAARLDEFYSNGLPYIERKPQVHAEQYPINLLNTGLYGSMSLDYGRYNREQGITFPIDKYTLLQQTEFVEKFTRYDANGKLAYPVYLPERFTLEPWIGYRATLYEDAHRLANNPLTGSLDRFDFGSESRLMAQGGMDLSTRRAMEFDPFLDRYEKMRVLLEPALEYGYYLPDSDLEGLTTPTGGRFPYVDPTDDFRAEMHSMRTMLRARIQGKDANGVTSDFLRASVGFEYDVFPDENLRYDNFLFYDDLANENDQRFSDLLHEFALMPFPWWTLGGNLRFDIDDEEMRSQYYFTQFDIIKRAQLSIGYYTFRYPFLNLKEQRDASVRLNWDISRKWALYYEMRFDIDEERFRRNTIGLMRNMYDFYGTIEIEHENHPTLGDDFGVSIGIQLMGPKGRPQRVEPGAPSFISY
ncbi:LPS assembly protein LptD [bacterium]|nr:LPS assembly protein LptD [bacterium]